MLYNYRIGVIGDTVGSGKSLSILSLICNKKNFENIPIENNSENDLIKIKKKYSQTNYICCNLLVVPHNIVKQWEGYIKNHSKLSYYVISRKSHCKPNINEYNNIHIILISSSQYNYFTNNYDFENKIFSRIFYDEADSLNIPNNRKIPAFFYWFITSSVCNLLFPSGYYYTHHSQCSDTCYSNCSGFNKVHVNGIKRNGFIKKTFRSLEKTSNLDYYLKNDEQFIKNSFSIIEPKKKIIDCKISAQFSIIEDVIGKDLLDMLNAGDQEGAISKLNMIHNDEHNIIKLVSKKLKNNIENYQKKKIFLLSLHVASEKERKQKIEKIDVKIASIYNRINNIENKIKNYTHEICPICYESLNKPIAVTNCCQNLFCFNCLTKSICMTNQKCPLCREYLLSNQDFYLLENIPNKKKTKPLPSKLEALETLLNIKKKEKSKILIFSSYNNTFNKIKNVINATGLSYSKISGNMGTINNVLTNFKQGNINILLLNSEYYGTGMNLPEATDIIIYHKMSHEIETQVIGRAQRLGRTTQLKIYYLYHSNEKTSCNSTKEI